jgi:hypothetical protein
MPEFDMSDYVDLAAQAFVAETTVYDWNKLPEVTKHQYREVMLPVTTAILDEYKKNHSAHDFSFLDGIG